MRSYIVKTTCKYEKDGLPLTKKNLEHHVLHEHHSRGEPQVITAVVWDDVLQIATMQFGSEVSHIIGTAIVLYKNLGELLRNKIVGHM